MSARCSHEWFAAYGQHTFDDYAPPPGYFRCINCGECSNAHGLQAAAKAGSPSAAKTLTRYHLEVAS